MGIKITGINEAIEKFTHITNNLESTMMSGAMDSGLYLKQEIERRDSRYLGQMQVLPDPSIPGVIVFPSPEGVPEAMIKEIGQTRAGYMRARCPKQLYFETALRKYVKGTPVMREVVNSSLNIIRDIMLEHIRKLIRG